MAFKLKENLITDAKIIETEKQKVFSCKTYKGNLSSVTGIISKFLYITRIDQFTGEALTPTVRIICGEECKTKCINL